jgi:HK97 family phage major capsid protein
MLNLSELERQLEAKKQEGLALVAKTTAAAEAEDRVITDEERAAIQAITNDGMAIKDKIARLRGMDAVNEQLQALTTNATRVAPRVLKSLGEQFVTSAAYDFFKGGGHRTSAAWRSPSVELFLGTTLTSDPASGGALIVPDYQPGILPIVQRRLMVADLFAPGTTDSNVVTYMQETLFTNAAAPVLEGGAKPESALTFAPVTDPVRKIAHWLPVTEEMLEDVAQIRSYIDARLKLGVQLAEENQLLNGDGVAPNLLGVSKRAGLKADVVRGVAENIADAIFRQIMGIFATSFLMPDGIAINPTDWATTALMKTTTGEYLTGGPFADIQTPTLWGLPLAVTPVQPVGVALVGAYKQAAQIFRKGGIRVEASNSHNDYFIKNLVAIRAEERLALAVYRPGAFGEVTSLGPVALLAGDAPAGGRGSKG